METTIVIQSECWLYSGFFWGYIGIMEKKMETTIVL